MIFFLSASGMFLSSELLSGMFLSSELLSGMFLSNELSLSHLAARYTVQHVLI